MAVEPTPSNTPEMGATPTPTVAPEASPEPAATPSLLDATTDPSSAPDASSVDWQALHDAVTLQTQVTLAAALLVVLLLAFIAIGHLK